MKTVIRVQANAKINLYLDIIGRLENGFHSLLMLMQSVNLPDTLTLHLTQGGEIALTCSQPDLPCDRRNLAWKAAEVFFAHTRIANPGIAIHIEKRIPSEAGLAGGSADAAAVIAGLNRLLHSNCDDTTLRKIALCVGSDVPFCLTGGTMLAQNTGDILSPLPETKPCFVLLVKPCEGVSTAEAYAAFDRVQNITHPDTVRLLSAAAAGDFAGVCRYSANVFEQVVQIPILSQLKDVLLQHDARLARMSGSGPTIFGLFEQCADAQNAMDVLSTFPVETFLCSPAPTGLVLTEIM